MNISTLPKAISKKRYLDHIDQYKDKLIVVYCTISYRSGVFAREMDGQGIAVKNLTGGILAWTLEGGQVYDASSKAVNRIHVYGDKWDYAPQGYHTVKFGLLKQVF
jgi:sodium/bile acid cotransporter 7